MAQLIPAAALGLGLGFGLNKKNKSNMTQLVSRNMDNELKQLASSEATCETEIANFPVRALGCSVTMSNICTADTSAVSTAVSTAVAKAAQAGSTDQKSGFMALGVNANNTLQETIQNVKNFIENECTSTAKSRTFIENSGGVDIECDRGEDSPLTIYNGGSAKSMCSVAASLKLAAKVDQKAKSSQVSEGLSTGMIFGSGLSSCASLCILIAVAYVFFMR